MGYQLPEISVLFAENRFAAVLKKVPVAALPVGLHINLALDFTPKFWELFPKLEGVHPMQKSKHQILAAAIARILKPLIRILLRNGISYGTFADIAKRQFIDVARNEFSIEGRKQSVSRVSIITGLTRKEVRRVAGLNPLEEQDTAERYNRASRVVAGWRRDVDFLDKKGKPMLLSISGNANSFQALVKRYSGDVPYRAVLDELEGDGSVERIDENLVQLTQRAYLPKADESMKLHILGVDTALLIDTIDHNLKADQPFPRFQRKVLYDNLPDEALPEFQRLSARASQKLLEKFDAWLSLHDRDTRPSFQGSNRNLAGIGIYYFEGPLSDREENRWIRQKVRK